MNSVFIIAAVAVRIVPLDPVRRRRRRSRCVGDDRAGHHGCSEIDIGHLPGTAELYTVEKTTLKRLRR
ncbi:hypothetical protein G6038_21260 [Rhodococcus sp. 14C212]|uniref:hypothetical protein n=1 Tax=Rhodococcus sp. 14C212 TaxID=2711209 RepID=UPI0013EB6AFA|nr:hypothetical protein [Rhodococcus sp. 14C212]NGP07965.1 hypothetical protein [Rhodococcus sp. 14C212]